MVEVIITEFMKLLFQIKFSKILINIIIID
jgi:hypothetical protein